ncbi:hypothetical protein OZX56_05420 [Lactobacillus sp. ESL0684]|uniref:hypothetical protein n=1 Tax=unclassified Lactobacillus TaxID=2620435 RepID=UPI0023F724A5|nr:MULTISPECIES: hypothetical protein [unclassified Lactobacillus]WEV40332.1 hypothetical protein OZX59_09210 [Lactobacillus sp. ESL0681]WEV42989.1 hypothetical protein OZX56_05420 [Lactobacillus sp. ESL0684]
MNITKDDLTEMIEQQATEDVENRLTELLPQGQGESYQKVRMAYQALQNTIEFKQFKQSFIEFHNRALTNNLLSQLGKIPDMIKEAGDNYEAF